MCKCREWEKDLALASFNWNLLQEMENWLEVNQLLWNMKVMNTQLEGTREAMKIQIGRDVKDKFSKFDIWYHENTIDYGCIIIHFVIGRNVLVRLRACLVFL